VRLLKRLLDERDVLKRPWCWVVGHDWESNAGMVGPSTGGKVVPLRFCWRCTKGFRLP
jgi:hypothetical protein